MQAAAYSERFASHPSGSIGGEKDDHVGNVGWLAGATERGLGDQAFLPVGSNHAGGVCAFGFDQAGIDRVDANAARSQFTGEDAGDRIDRTLRSGVNCAAGVESDD